MTASSTRKGIAVLFAGRLVEKVIGFIALILYARFFTPSELAIVPLLFLFGNLGPVLFGFGVMPTLVMELPKLVTADPGKAASLARHSLGLGLAVALGSTLVTYFVAIGYMDNKETLDNTTSLWLAAGVGLQGLYTLLTQMLVGTSRFTSLAVANTLASVLRLALLVPLHHVFGTAGIAGGLAIAALVGCLFALLKLRETLLNRQQGNYSYGQMFRLSWPFYLEGFLMYFRSQGDQLAVTGILGTEMLAQYYIARRLYDMLRALSESVESALIPLLAKVSLEGSERFAEKWHLLFRSGLSLGIVTALVSIATVPFYISLVGTDKYHAALWPSVILVLVFVADLFKIIIGRSIFILCPPIRRLQLTIFESILLFPLLIGGTYLMGAIGTALAALISGMGAAMYAYHMLRKIIDIRIGTNDYTEILGPSALAFGAMSLVMIWMTFSFGQNTVALGIATGMGVAVFLLVFINLGSTKLLDSMMGSLGLGKESNARQLLFKIRFRGGKA